MLQVGSVSRKTSLQLEEASSASEKARVTMLDRSHFHRGTLRIRSSGTYRLAEDITFSPNHPGRSWSRIPPDTAEYPQQGGYFLGFFAAVAIEANNVELDCQGHEIKMAPAFHKRQRFYSNIELGSSPFPLGQGPPQFASTHSTTMAPVVANHTVIKNCRLGLSSHHSIHGNDNRYVTIDNVQMYDFEVAGVSLNGASHVDMRHLKIGPSLRKTFRATLSQAIYLDHVANTLMEANSAVALAKRMTPVVLRRRGKSAHALFRQLRKDLVQYMADGTGSLKDVVGDGNELPDGSAVYGLLLHRSGIAVNELGFCADDADMGAERVSNISLQDINISGLSIKVNQVARLFVHDKVVMGPAGDVFQPTRLWTGSCFKYRGNSLSDAQIAIGKTCRALEQILSAAEHKFYCGGTNIPFTVLDWAAGKWTCGSTIYWVRAISRKTHWSRLDCKADAMSHYNKGAFGMRLGFQEDVTVKDVLVEDIENRGTPNALAWCGTVGEPYEGVDTRAVSLAHMKDVNELHVKSHRLHSSNSSRVFPITGFLQVSTETMRADDVKARD